MNLKKLCGLSKISDQPVATGSSCSIFRGIRTDQMGLKRDVALKVVKDRSYFQELVTEWDQGSQIASRYLVQIIDVGVFQGSPTLVMEYVDGFTLFELVKRGLLEDCEKVFLLQQTKVALQELHELGRVHGDLSPKNIMVNRDGEIKLIDFGLSKLDKSNGRCTTQFASQEFLKHGRRSSKGDFESFSKIKDWVLADTKKDIKNRFLDQSLPNDVSNSIGEKIKKLKSMERDTSALPDKPGPSRLSRGFKYYSLLFLVSLILPWPAAQSKRFIDLESGRLEIRTQKWVEVSIDGKYWYQSPNSISLAPGTYRLKWKSLYNYGEVVLTVGIGDRIFLADQVFEGSANGIDRSNFTGTHTRSH